MIHLHTCTDHPLGLIGSDAPMLATRIIGWTETGIEVILSFEPVNNGTGAAGLTPWTEKEHAEYKAVLEIHEGKRIEFIEVLQKFNITNAYENAGELLDKVIKELGELSYDKDTYRRLSKIFNSVVDGLITFRKDKLICFATNLQLNAYNIYCRENEDYYYTTPVVDHLPNNFSVSSFLINNTEQHFVVVDVLKDYNEFVFELQAYHVLNASWDPIESFSHHERIELREDEMSNREAIVKLIKEKANRLSQSASLSDERYPVESKMTKDLLNWLSYLK